MMRIGTKPVNGEVFVAEGKLADVLIYKPGSGSVCKAFQGGLFVKGEGGVFFQEGGHGVFLKIWKSPSGEGLFG